MSKSRLEISPELTALALTYSNKSLIAEEIFPKVPTGTRSFKYYEYDKNNYFSVPETIIGEKGKANKVEYRGKELTAAVQDHALEEDLPVSRVKETQNALNINLKEKAVNQVTALLKTRKEILAARLLNNTASYGGASGNVKTLEASEKINKEDSNALKIIQNAADEMLYKPNMLIASRKAMSALRMNPFIVDACGSAAKKAGLVSAEAIKSLFDVEKILTGESVHNTAKKGQAVNLQSCWDNNIILLYIDRTADINGGITFGFEAVYEEIQAGEYHDSSLGTQGCDIVKAFYSSIFLAVCKDCGYLIKDVLA